MNSVITPVVLAGGAGTRLWPLSRKSYPKEFSNLIGGKSLFQQSALRLTSSDVIKFAPHITMTNSASLWARSCRVSESNQVRF